MNLFILFICLIFVLSASDNSEASIPTRKRTNMIVVHHSDTPNGNVANFRKYHMEKGWGDIGYHYVILRNGIIERGRPENLVGAHAKSGGRNRKSIGICLVGENDFTAEQIKSLKFLMKSLCMKHGIKEIQRHHSQCPGVGLPLEKIAQEILG